MNDRGRLRAGLQADTCEEVICPKPQRMALISCSSPELIKPMRQWQSPAAQISECEAGYEILEIFLNKATYAESPNFGCSPPYFFGSPPSRAGNPVIHDVQFCRQKSPPPIVIAEPKALSGPSFPASPSIRIEGFDCSRRDSRCSVSAIA